ncbi:MAG: shikimate dehydrogenase [Gammaproteobacteria bacterium]|nr:shikimate dehydrogenase [Gammaproteobacteria bacterium]
MAATRKPRYLTGLIGAGISASRSPYLHEGEADALGLRLVYSLFDLPGAAAGDPKLAALLDAAEVLGFSGLNITYPFKQAVLPLLDDLSEDASAIGAVNTVAFRNGVRIGYNTDVLGFGTSLTRCLAEAAFDTVLQIGAGGAGAATAFALLRHGVGQLRLYDTDPAKAAALQATLARRFGAARVALVDDIPGGTAGANGIVNATPMGMASHPGTPLPTGLLRSDMWVADIVYFPLETELLAAARAMGCPTMDGSRMVVYQAAAAFEIFTGIAPDAERMLAAFDRDAAIRAAGGRA